MPSAGRDEQPEQGSAAAGGRVGEFGRGRPPTFSAQGLSLYQERGAAAWLALLFALVRRGGEKEEWRNRESAWAILMGLVSSCI